MYIRDKRPVLFFIMVPLFFLFFSCASKEETLEEAPIITSATYQHTLYNGRAQPVEAAAAKDDVPPLVVTYFTSEENLLRDEGGSLEPPAAVGDYFARIERPGGRGYKRGPDIKVEYHIQKALVTISAEEKQEYVYDGKPKPAAASVEPPVELECTYYLLDKNDAGGTALTGPPAECGSYRVHILYPGGANYMGASKEVELVIRRAPVGEPSEYTAAHSL
jgi:hypothetical protein